MTVRPRACVAMTITTGSSSMSRGTIAPADLGPAQRRRRAPSRRRAARPRPRARSSSGRRRRPSRASDVEEPGAGRVHARGSATVTSEPGSAAAPQRKNAAEEMSPGTSTRPPRGRAGATRHLEPVHPHRARPCRASIRSVWSRERSGSATEVSPSAKRPGEQARALHLRARDLEDVARAAQRPRRARPPAAAGRRRARRGPRPSGGAAR